jgi:hypothetical protein
VTLSWDQVAYLKSLKDLRVRILLFNLLAGNAQSSSIVDVGTRFTRVRMVSRSLQVLWKKYFSSRSPVKLSLASLLAALLVQRGGLVYTLYGSTTNDIVTSEQRGAIAL